MCVIKEAKRRENNKYILRAKSRTKVLLDKLNLYGIRGE
jgi:hypothetical protein